MLLPSDGHKNCDLYRFRATTKHSLAERVLDKDCRAVQRTKWHRGRENGFCQVAIQGATLKALLRWAFDLARLVSRAYSSVVIGWFNCFCQ